MAEPKDPPFGSIRVYVPKGLKAGAAGLARMCDWTIEQETDEVCLVALAEREDKTKSARLKLEHVIAAADAEDRDPYEKFSRWNGHDRYIRDSDVELGTKRFYQFLEIGRREAFWSAFGLLNLISRDKDLASNLREIYQLIAREIPKSSLWMIDVDPVLIHRRAVIRALFAASEAPELLDPNRQFGGFESGKGLGFLDGVDMAQYINTALLAGAPGLVGIASGRLTGVVLVLFGHYESGRTQGSLGETIDLYRSNLLSTPIDDVVTMPKLEPGDVEHYVTWWIEHLNEELAITLDPAFFPAPDGRYDARRHLGFVLSFERMVAAVNELLVGSRRDEFQRRLLFFQVMDLLKGMRLGDYHHLLNPTKVREQLTELEQVVPPEVAKIIMPRIVAAVEALEKLENGFFIPEQRQKDGFLRVKSKASGDQLIGIDKATSEYLNLVRDALHSFGEAMTRPFDRSLFAAHNGYLPPELSDLAFFHMLRLIANPNLLRFALRPELAER